MTLRGYTLVEILVAIALFALGVAALLPLAVANLRAVDAAGVRTEALALAREKAEELRAVPFEELGSAVPGADAPGAGLTREWDFASAPTLPGDGSDLRRIVVRVAWDLPGRGAGEVVLPLARARY